MIHNPFRWSGVTRARKSALVGFYVWSAVSAVLLATRASSLGGFALVSVALSAICLALALFVSDRALVKSLPWLDFPWPL
jgi:hypothetical protein